MALKASEVVAALAKDESYAYMGICQAQFVTNFQTRCKRLQRIGFSN